MSKVASGLEELLEMLTPDYRLFLARFDRIVRSMEDDESSKLFLK